MLLPTVRLARQAAVISKQWQAPSVSHLSLFLRIKMSGKHSRCLCGPGEGLGAC